jgi:predicted HTH transcriptional regulator
MLFKDRLEIWNPGSLPPTLTLEKLRGPHASVPHNPLLAEPMYLTKYIERMGTGIRDMIHRCRKAGLPEPEIRIDAGSFVLTIRRKAPESGDQPELRARPRTDPVTDPVTDPAILPVERVVLALSQGEMAPSTLWECLGLKHRPTFRENYLRPALEQSLIEPTIPEKPSSRLQKYRLTAKGQALLTELEKPGGNT